LGEVENMSITLNQILALVGKLDDLQGDGTPRERFRRFLKENGNEVENRIIRETFTPGGA
jgi:hypothetical protein